MFVSGPFQIHDHNLVLSQTFTSFEMDLLYNERREEISDYYWSLPLY
jgi:hypothetical protein